MQIIIIVFSILISISYIILAYSYGDLQYNRGRLAGFKECSAMTKEMLRKLIEGEGEVAEEALKDVNHNSPGC